MRTLAALLLLHAAILGQGAENYATWTHTRDIYFNTTGEGANVPVSVRNFPVLVRLDASNFLFPEAQASGHDIRFAKSNGSHLRYEIETWDAARQFAAIWVRMDTVIGNSKDQYIHMYWGNPAAPDSSNGRKVFVNAEGFGETFHLGGTGDRPNSSGGMVGTPYYYSGDQSVRGISGLCDTLRGKSDYLEIGDWYDGYDKGFTFSVWLNPSAVRKFSHVLELGNGRGLDNIILQRNNNSNDMYFTVWKGGQQTLHKPITTGILVTGEWQNLVVTMAGKYLKIYRNGALVTNDSLDFGIPAVVRAFNYLGHSSWVSDSSYQGKIDEAWLQKTTRDANWVKLSYANQQPVQTLIEFQKPPPTCLDKFSASGDTTVGEATALELRGVADCAVSFSWTAPAPAPAILDPDVKTLQVFLPRLSSSAVLAYTFRAVYGNYSMSRTVTVGVREEIPDPVFTFPDTINWNGRDSMMLKPTVLNLAAVKASRAPALNLAWKVSGPVPDTAWRDDGLLLREAIQAGVRLVELCMDNGGPSSCQMTHLKISGTVGLLPDSRERRAAPRGAYKDALGRRDAEKRPVRIFLRPNPAAGAP